MEVNVVIVRVTVVTYNRAAWNTCNRRGEAIIETDFESSGIE